MLKTKQQQKVLIQGFQSHGLDLSSNRVTLSKSTCLGRRFLSPEEGSELSSQVYYEDWATQKNMRQQEAEKSASSTALPALRRALTDTQSKTKLLC